MGAWSVPPARVWALAAECGNKHGATLALAEDKDIDAIVGADARGRAARARPGSRVAVALCVSAASERAPLGTATAARGTGEDTDKAKGEIEGPGDVKEKDAADAETAAAATGARPAADRRARERARRNVRSLRSIDARGRRLCSWGGRLTVCGDARNLRTTDITLTPAEYGCCCCRPRTACRAACPSARPPSASAAVAPAPPAPPLPHIVHDWIAVAKFRACAPSECPPGQRVTTVEALMTG